MPLATVDSGDPDLPLLRADNGTLQLTFLPSVGGRLLSIVASGRELLWRNPDYFDADFRVVRRRSAWARLDGSFSSWANIGGSKTWPAPQGWAGEGEWAGPPDDVLDAGVWSIDVAESETGDMTVVMTSPEDQRSGLRITRRFEIPVAGAEFRQLITFTNVSDRPITWAIWEVCQVDTGSPDGRSAEGSVVVVPHVGEAVELDLGTYEGELGSKRRGHDVVLPLGTGVAKRGYPDASGSVELHGPDGLEIGLATSPVEAATWPDGGSKVEVWLQRPTAAPIESLEGLHPSAHLVELEVLGPLTTLAPGATSTLDVEWSTARL